MSDMLQLVENLAEGASIVEAIIGFITTSGSVSDKGLVVVHPVRFYSAVFPHFHA